MTHAILKKAGKPLSKVLVVFLVFMFFITPLAPVLADQVDGGSSDTSATSDAGAVTDTATQSQDTQSIDSSSQADAGFESAAPGDGANLSLQITPRVLSGAAQETALPGEPAADSATEMDLTSIKEQTATDSPASPSPSVSGFSIEPSVPQASNNNPSLSPKLPEIDKNTGALHYNYSITIPPGRNNLQPDLQLSYNSNSNEQNGAFGYGFSLSIPFIQRLNKAGTDKLYNAGAASYFYSSQDGELVPAQGASYIAKTENGSFNKYAFSDNTWQVLSKDGTKYTYGADDASRQNDPQNQGNVYKWMLKEIRDANDNYISFSYLKDAGQIYPSTIKYTGHGSSDGIFEIDFLRTQRPDNGPSFTTGFPVASNYYINEIIAKVSGSQVTKYVLSYVKSKDSNRSLLGSITVSGRDANGVVTALPPTNFSYQNDGGTGWTPENTSWKLPEGFSENLQRMPPYFTDLNGDGLTDLVLTKLIVGNPDTFENHQYLNNGNGWTETSAWRFPEGEWDFLSSPLRFADLNGDGLADAIFIKRISGNPNVYENYEYLNNGNGWTQNSTWHFPNLPAYTPGLSPQFIDLNGDGLADLLLIEQVSANPPTHRDREYINNGNGWTEAPAWKFPGDFSENLQRMPPYFTDLNGDGLTDLVLTKLIVGNPDTFESHQYLNNGNGWTETLMWRFPEGEWDFLSSPLRFADLNGDGLADAIFIKRISGNPNVYENYEYLNNGNGWTQNSLWHFASTIVIPGIPLQFVDLNGDGLADLNLIERVYGNPYTYKDHHYINTGKKQDLLAQITYPQGGATAITYKAAAQYTDSSQNPTNKSPYPIMTVSQIVTNDGAGNINNLSYAYQGGTYYYNGPFDRQFSGYQTITQTDSAGNVAKTFYNTGKGSDAAGGQFQDDYWKIGKAYRIEQYDNAGNLFSKTINKWDSVDLGNGSKFVKLAQTLAQTYDGSASHRDSAQSYAYDTSNGNVTQKTQYGEVVGNSDGSFSDTANDKFVTDYTYATEVSSFKFQVSSQTTNDQFSNKVKETKYYYDALPLGSLTKGNLTKQEDLKSANAYISSQKTYNSFGLITSSIDPRGNATQYSYDANNLYPATITNAKGQTTSYHYDYAFGQVTQKTDLNGRVFQYAYDGLGRLVSEKQPDLVSPLTLVIKATHAYTDTKNAVSVKKSSYLNDSNTADSFTYFDGLGRKIQERQEAENGNFSVKDYAYNNVGQLAKESLPYFSTGSNKTWPTSDLALYANYTYDALGRAITIANAVGVTTNAYDDWRVTVTDANGKSKDLYKDAYGNLVQVDEHPSASSGQVIYSTFYNYDYLGNTIKITDALNNIRNFTYDGLGRRLTAQDLHAAGDTSFGTWSYAYDNSGNLNQVVDPKNQTIAYAYDELNRMTAQDYAGSPGVEVTNTYDSGVNGKGRLTGIASSNLAQTNTYNALGLLKTESKIIDSITYLTAYDYDWQGSQTLVTNPDDSQVKNVYNSAGLLDKTQRKESTDESFVDVVSNIDYAPAGQIAAMYYANGAVTTNTYDAAKLYRLTKKVTAIAGGANGQDVTYTYDNVGNIITAVDASATNASKTTQYGYDDLYRLTSAVAGNVSASQSTYAQTYVYDAIGNMVTKTQTIGSGPSVTFTYAYTGNTGASYANPHAVTSVSDGTNTTSYGYDNNGNMVTEEERTHSFDYNNRLAETSIPGEPVSSPVPVTTTFYPTAGDGSVYRYNSRWNTVHNSANGTAPRSTINVSYITAGRMASGNFIIERAFFPFNTASLPDNATVTSAKLKVFVAKKLNNDNDGDDWVSVVQSSQPSTSSLVVSDYSKDGVVTNPVEGSDVADRKDFSNIPVNQYTVFNLNATGQSWISKTGVTRLGLREGHDIKNVAFAGTVGKYNQLQLRSSEYTGTSNDPVLEVTYTMPAPVPSASVTAFSYDTAGQRITLTNPAGVTTHYPTKGYNSTSSLPAGNTDGTNIVKHIGNVATVTGTGNNANIYYSSTDSLNSSSIMTDSAGTIMEVMDYYPFGSLRIDQKSGNFSEQRKYIGQEFDQDTGLNYLNARYYDSAIGRFISEDPMFWSLPKELLLDPQQLNSYAYARNNPIGLSDPSGLVVVTVSGTTNLTTFGNGVSNYLQYDNSVQQQISNTFKGQDVFNFSGWSGSNSDSARRTGADNLNSYISGIMKNYPANEPLNIVDHSHGHNVVVLYSQEQGAHKIDNLISFEPPVRNEYVVNQANVSNMITVHGTGDKVQTWLAGRNVSDFIFALGLATLSPLNILLGLSFEAGTAGKDVPGASKSINVNTLWYQPIGSHSATLHDKEAWSQIRESIK